MKKYLNRQGNSGVTGYKIDAGGISVAFNDNAVYLYTNTSAGVNAIEKMKELAIAGKGLSTYISKNVKDKFEKKIR